MAAEASPNPPAPLATYTEKLLQVRRVFRLYPDRVTVQARWLLRGSFQTTVPLAELDPKFTAFSIRYRLVKRAILVGSLAVAAAVVFGQPDYAPWGPRLAPVGWAIAAACAVFAARAFKKIPFIRFRARDSRAGRGGAGGLDIACAGPDVGGFDDFVRAVQKRIRQVQR